MQTLTIGTHPPTGLPKRLAIVFLGALTLAACESDSVSRDDGIESLGDDFVRAFSQDPNDEPLEASDLDLELTPGIEPFDP